MISCAANQRDAIFGLSRAEFSQAIESTNIVNKDESLLGGMFASTIDKEAFYGRCISWRPSCVSADDIS
jgi:hypothetical protein